MKGWMTWQAITLALPVILGPLTYLVMGWLKLLAKALDKAPAVVQRSAVVVIAAVIAAVGEWVGIRLECVGQEVGCTLADIDPPFIKATLGAAVAMVIHRLRQTPPRPTRRSRR